MKGKSPSREHLKQAIRETIEARSGLVYIDSMPHPPDVSRVQERERMKVSYEDRVV